MAYLVLFVIFCALPLPIQLILLIVDILMAPGIGTVLMILGIIIGRIAKK